MVEVYQNNDRYIVKEEYKDVVISVECKSVEEGLQKIEEAKTAQEQIWQVERAVSYIPHPYTIAQWIREYRNRLLVESDWTQLPDAPLKEEERKAWKDYRQALRDLPQTWGLAPAGAMPETSKVSIDLSDVKTKEDIEKLPWPERPK